jgi:hypothetical protein
MLHWKLCVYGVQIQWEVNCELVRHSQCERLRDSLKQATVPTLTAHFAHRFPFLNLNPKQRHPPPLPSQRQQTYLDARDEITRQPPPHNSSPRKLRRRIRIESNCFGERSWHQKPPHTHAQRSPANSGMRLVWISKVSHLKIPQQMRIQQALSQHLPL